MDNPWVSMVSLGSVRGHFGIILGSAGSNRGSRTCYRFANLNRYAYQHVLTRYTSSRVHRTSETQPVTRLLLLNMENLVWDLLGLQAWFKRQCKTQETPKVP